jgi:hypothetical protein
LAAVELVPLVEAHVIVNVMTEGKWANNQAKEECKALKEVVSTCWYLRIVV